MTRDDKKLLRLLQEELAFLEKGGYRQTARAAWRPHFIFQDSPICLNFDPTQEPRPCNECALNDLIPPELRNQKIPCRFIPVGADGETIDSFYRHGTHQELEDALRRWLKATIARLQQEVAAASAEQPEHAAQTGLSAAG